MTSKKLLIGASSVLAFSAPALAQQGAPPTAPQTAPDATAEDSRDVVIITGTALNRKEAIEEIRRASRTRIGIATSD